MAWTESDCPRAATRPGASSRQDVRQALRRTKKGRGYAYLYWLLDFNQLTECAIRQNRICPVKSVAMLQEEVP